MIQPVQIQVPVDAIVTVMTAALLAMVGFMYRQSKQQTKMAIRLDWLTTRYAMEHDETLPWDEPLTDGGGDWSPLGANDTVNPLDWYKDLTYKEVHLLVEGLFRGIMDLPFKRVKLQGSVLSDSWYAKGGFIIGWSVKIAVVALVGQSALPALGI